MSERALKKKVLALLKSEDVDRAMDELTHLPDRELIHGLFSGICDLDENARWRAVAVMGRAVATIADRDLEAARVIMRRLLWSLNDESGGIGWGAPEAMAEIMSSHEELAREFAHILVSYMREDGNFLEHLPLQRGLLWAIGRLGRVRPELLTALHAPRYLLPYLESPDVKVAGLAAWAAGAFTDDQLTTALHRLTGDHRQVRCFTRRFRETTVGHLAADSLELIHRKAAEHP